MKRAVTYKTEADLCADFIAAVRHDGKWECYPETAGWDILCVRASDGAQVGVEAKLRFNARVLNQALEEYGWAPDRSGPDYRAVLCNSNWCLDGNQRDSYGPSPDRS